MSRRIVYAFAIAGCSLFVAPASADRECFESSCRMPEVMVAPEPQPEAIVEPAAGEGDGQQASQSPAVVAPGQESVAQGAPAKPHSPPVRNVSAPETVPLPAARPAPATASGPAPIAPQMVVDRSPPALKPLPFSPHEPVRPPSRTAGRDAGFAHEPVEIANRSYAGSDTAPAANVYVQPSAGIIVVTPAYSYGGDGLVMVHKRNDPSWKLCQTDHGRRDTTCSPYQYHAYGEHGYRPLGSYRVQRAVPVRVHVPDARIVAVND